MITLEGREGKKEFLKERDGTEWCFGNNLYHSLCCLCHHSDRGPHIDPYPGVDHHGNYPDTHRGIGLNHNDLETLEGRETGNIIPFFGGHY